MHIKVVIKKETSYNNAHCALWFISV